MLTVALAQSPPGGLFGRQVTLAVKLVGNVLLQQSAAISDPELLAPELDAPLPEELAPLDAPLPEELPLLAPPLLEELSPL